MPSKNTQYAILLLIIIVILISGYALFMYKDSIETNESPVQQQQTQNSPITIEDQRVMDKNSPLNIDVIYPYIKTRDDFNAKVLAIIDPEIKSFKENSLANDAAAKETDPQGYNQYPRQYDLKITYEKGIVDENTISIIFTIYSFTGGAHGNGYFASLNYNLKDSKEITLADLFPGQNDYLKTVSEYCTADLTKQIKQRMGNTEGTWMADGASPKAENFSVFKINQDSLTFYFSPYQVAPYAAGDFKCTMPR